MKKHDFHICLTKTLKSKIFNLSKKLNLSMSKVVALIIEKSIIMFDKYQIENFESENISKYQRIFWDGQMHIFIDQNLYRKIKHICGIMHVFNMAILIRKLLSIYFEYKEKFNLRFEEVLQLFDMYSKKIKERYFKKGISWEKNKIPIQLYGKKF